MKSFCLSTAVLALGLSLFSSNVFAVVLPVGTKVYNFCDDLNDEVNSICLGSVEGSDETFLKLGQEYYSYTEKNGELTLVDLGKQTVNISRSSNGSVILNGIIRLADGDLFFLESEELLQVINIQMNP